MSAAIIRCALISRGEVVLCDYRGNFQGNFEFTCQQVLSQVLQSQSNASNQKFSFDHAKYTYHAYTSENLIYLCVADAMFDKNIAFDCLLELENQFASMGLKNRAESAGSYSLRTAFESRMATVLEKYSESDTLGRMKSKVDDVTGIMKQNIDKVVERGDALGNLNERSDLLAHSSTEFRQSAAKLRKKLCWKNVKLWIILIVSIILVFVFIVIIILAVLASEGKFKK